MGSVVCLDSLNRCRRGNRAAGELGNLNEGGSHEFECG